MLSTETSHVCVTMFGTPSSHVKCISDCRSQLKNSKAPSLEKTLQPTFFSVGFKQLAQFFDKGNS